MLTTPLWALPYCAGNPPVMTSTSSSALAIGSNARSPVNGLTMLMPLMRYSSSPVRPPRKCPSDASTVRPITSVSEYTPGDSWMSRGRMIWLDAVRSGSMSGRVAVTTSPSPPSESASSSSTKSAVVVRSLLTTTPS